MKNKIISILIIFVIIISMLTPFTKVQAQVELEQRYTLDELRVMYPTGMQWNDTFDGSSECHGFASLIYSKYYGIKPNAYAEIVNDVEQTAPGDMVRYNGHTVFILTRSGETVTVVECNYDLQNHVRWDQRKTMGELRNNFERIYKAPYVLGGTPGTPQKPQNAQADTSAGLKISWDKVSKNCLRI